ncbi:uncharacterized protein LOC135470786 [Liolophura sinensis]|uniref:uncharacterized protein LOC135470786 n=1 Tax=Liolophura sinensis TaxID=3198878 RepID=UPI0031584899
MATGVTSDHVRSEGIEMTQKSLDCSRIAMSPPSENAVGGNDILGSQEVTCNTLSSQLAGTLNFANKNGQSISAFPIIVDFRRLIQAVKELCKRQQHYSWANGCAESLNTFDKGRLLHQTTNQELLHAVVGLFDVSLSEMTADVLYASVCDKWAKTILLIQDLKEAIKALEERKNRPKKTEEEHKPESEEEDKETGPECSDVKECVQEDVYEPEESPASLFAEVFSDTESEEEEDDESDDEDFSKGIHSFIKSVSERKQIREKSQCIESSHVGIENRIVGCLTFEKKYINHTVKVVHLTLLTVRRRCRKFGIGRYLMKQVLDPSVVGPYDAVVVHADNGALDFFQRCGFSDDVVLNSRWSELAEQFTNCTLMCYLPGFSDPTFPGELMEKCKSLIELDKEMKNWKEKSVEAYQAQVTCHMRMRQEILQLHKLAMSQRSFIDELTQQNEKLYKEKLTLGQDLLDSRMDSIVSTVKGPHHQYPIPADGEDGEDVDTHSVMRELERRVEMIDMMRRSRQRNPLLDTDGGRSYRAAEEAFVRSQVEPYDHTQDAADFYSITERFKTKMAADKSLTESYEVSMITKACLSREAESNFWLCLATMVDPSCSVQLYYCGSADTPNRLQAILKDGFSRADFSQGSYGQGIYFSEYPSKAAKFSVTGKLILADVVIGKHKSLFDVNPDLKSPGTGFDSVLCPGRLSTQRANNQDPNTEEFIIFNSSQAKPLCLISYQAVKTKV